MVWRDQVARRIEGLKVVFESCAKRIMYIFPTIFAKTSCMMNPILYGFTNRFLRKELLSVLKKWFGLTTPMEDFQIMRLRQQEGLYNKEGVYTGRNHCLCTCDRCAASRRLIFPSSDAVSQRALIDLYIRQQREKDAEEAKKTMSSSRPTSLNLHVPNSGFVTRSASLNIQMSVRDNTERATLSTGSAPGRGVDVLKILSLPELTVSQPDGTLGDLKLEHNDLQMTAALPSNSQVITAV
ncbi:unnamed protein product [Allacma fusca]|uniref:Uncharacterized protein n=1 Tax=Allacma fusca TaxID=39272 RepID=A0A8J2JNY9_9HEXA|nr:unnamed protein product [Allacma fusca]